MKRTTFTLLSLLVIASMLLSACGTSAPSNNPLPTAGIPAGDTSGLPPQNFQAGIRWRETTLMSTADPNWFCSKNCGSGWDETWVTKEGDQILFGRTTSLVDTDLLLAKSIAGVEAAGGNTALVTVRQVAGETLVVTPDLGISWDAYWSTHVWDKNVATTMLDDLKYDFLPKAANKGLYWIDIGTHQVVITPAGKVIMVDFDGANLAKPGAFGSYRSFKAYQENYIRLLDGDLVYDNVNYPEIQKFRPIATAVAVVAVPQVEPIVSAPMSGKITNVAVLSKVDGATTIVQLNAEELLWLQTNDARIINVLASKGVAIPPKTIWGVLGRGTVMVVEIVGVVILAYTILETLNDIAGMGTTVQTSTFYDYIDPDPSAYSVYTELLARSYEATALFRSFKERTPEEVVGLYHQTGNICYKVRLDDPSVINVTQVIGVDVDHDIVTPIQICAGDDTNGGSWVVYMNLTTGDRFEYTKVNEVWTGTVGCTNFYSLVSNQAASEYVDAEFEFCSDGYGLLTYGPTWVKP
jgi:hypothetical protein